MEASSLPEMNDAGFDPDSFRDDFFNCLSTLKSNGCFAIFEKLPDAVQPRLFLNGVGPIELPLSDHDAEAIIEVAKKTSFRERDTNNVWELFVDDFKLLDPLSQDPISLAVQRVVLGLKIPGYGGAVTAKIDRLQLFDRNTVVEGVSSHSQKTHDEIGTLVLCLPSAHEGGEIQFKWLQDKDTYDTARNSGCNRLMAWYSDVLVERRPVRSGYKLELVCHLQFTGNAINRTAILRKGRASLSVLLASWIEHSKGNSRAKHVIYGLRHPVTATLCHDALCSRDRAVLKHLQSASSAAGSHLCLANIEKRVIKAGSHGILPEATQELPEECITLSRVFQLDGVEITQNYQIAKDNMIGVNWLTSDQDDYGNYGYRRLVAVLVTDALILEKQNDVMKSSLDRIMRSLDFNPPNVEMIADFTRRCRFIIADMKMFFAKQKSLDSSAAPFSGEVMGLLFSLCTRLYQKEMFLEILSLNFMKIAQPFESCPTMFPAIGMGVAVFGIEILDVKLSTNINRIPSFHIRCTVLRLIETGFNELGLTSRLSKALPLISSNSFNPSAGMPVLDLTTNRSFSAWIERHCRWALIHCEMTRDEDFVDLLRLGTAYGTCFLINDVIPVVKKHASDASLVVVFLEELLKAAAEKKIPRDISQNAFQKVFPDLLENFSLCGAQDEVSEGGKHSNNRPCVAGAKGPPNFATSRSFFLWITKVVSLLWRCQSLGLESEFDQMITKILVQVSTSPVENLGDAFLKFLKEFLFQWNLLGDDVTKPRIRLLYQQGLIIYINRYVRREPCKPAGWIRYARHCRCEHCTALDAFLLDPNMRQRRFAKPFEARIHIISQFSTEDSEDYVFDTDMSTAAHVLVITKKDTCSQYPREMAAWKHRFATANKNILSLGNIMLLKDVLGDRYDAIVNLRSVRMTGELGAEGDDDDDVDIIALN